MIAPRAIVLPRPNPGPEPLPAPSIFPWILAGVGGLAILIAAIAIARRLRKPKTIEPVAERTIPAEADLETRLRERLASLFDPAWLNLTVDEIASKEEIRERFGEEACLHVLAFLRQAERIRFSGRPEDSEAGESWVTHFLEFTAGATSMINGR